jgi:hypothetical protein
MLYIVQKDDRKKHKRGERRGEEEGGGEKRREKKLKSVRGRVEKLGEAGKHECDEG